MSHPVRLERHSGVALISIDNPPLNALTARVRQGIWAGLNAALSNDNVKAVVLLAQGRTFAVGADIKELETDALRPSLSELCDYIEASPKPVVALLHGNALGGGLELAMAAHYRIAEPSCKFGLPEIRLGLVPGAGGTQRLPRLVGAKRALSLMLSGNSISADAALSAGLVDGLSEGDPRGDAILMAVMNKETRPTRNLRHHLSDGQGFMLAVEATRRALKRRKNKMLAEEKIAECVEAAAMMPFETGLMTEQAAFKECLGSSESEGMRHLFFAEREAAKFRDDAKVSAELKQVGIIGIGVDAAALTVLVLESGLEVRLWDSDKAALASQIDLVGAALRKRVGEGLITADAANASLEKLGAGTSPEALAKVNLLVEASRDEATEAGARLLAVAPGLAEDVPVALCDPFIGTEEVASEMNRPVLHFVMSPSMNFPEMVEISADQVGQPGVAPCLALAQCLNLAPLQVGPKRGLIVESLLDRLKIVADWMVLRGAKPSDVDRACRAFGFADGPFALQDRIGLRRSLSRHRALWISTNERGLPITAKLVMGKLQGRIGGGFYVYDQNGKRLGENPEANELIAAQRLASGVPHLLLQPSDIEMRMLFALIDEAADIIGKGIARRASDIDVISVLALGFPRVSGGLMKAADVVTPFAVAHKIQKWTAQDEILWSVSPYLERLAREREKFLSAAMTSLRDLNSSQGPEA